MPIIILPPLPVTGEDLLSEKTFSSIDDPYTLSTYAHLGSMDMGLDQGLMSTANGRLTQANLDDNFQLKDYHIQPEQASLARSESMLSSATIYGNGIPDIKDATNYFTVPGCSEYAHSWPEHVSPNISGSREQIRSNRSRCRSLQVDENNGT